jgi:transcriptional regulator with XRE-family HTH domain
MLLMTDTLDLRGLRDRAKLSRAAVMKALDLGSVTTIQNWETGHSPPTLTIPQVWELCRIYGCTLDELKEGSVLSLLKRGTTND